MPIQALVFMLTLRLKLKLQPKYRQKQKLISRPSLKQASKQLLILAVKLILIVKTKVNS